MYLRTHFLAGFLSARLFGFNAFYSIISGILAVLIDLDHPISYSIKHHKLKFKEVWNRCVREETNARSFFHKAYGVVLSSLAIIIIYLLLSREIATIIFSAYYSHIVLDAVKFKRKRHWDFGRIFIVRTSIEDIILDSLLLIGSLLSFL